MSIRELLLPETQDQAWSRLFCQSINANDVNSNGSSTFVDITVTNDANIGPNNFQVSNGVGLNGQVLSTDGLGVLSWVSDGGGNVLGPVGAVVDNITTFADVTGKLIKDSGVAISSVVVGPVVAVSGNLSSYNGVTGKIIADSGVAAASVVVGPVVAVAGNLASYNGVTGKLIADSGVATASLMLNPASADLDMDGNAIIDVDSIEIKNQVGAPPLPPAGSVQIYSVIGDDSVHVTNFDNSVSGAIALQGNDVSFKSVSFDSGAPGTQWLVPNVRATAVGQVLVDLGGVGTPVWGQGSLATSISDVAIVGPANLQVLTYNGAAWANADPLPSFSYSFGGTTGAAASYFITGGAWDNVNVAASDYKSQVVCPVQSKIMSATYATATGDATTQYETFVNGVSGGTFLLSGAIGYNALNVAVNFGNTIAVRWTGVGTDPGSGSVQLHLLL